MFEHPEIRERITLKELNTFGIQANCRWYFKAESETGLKNFLSLKFHSSKPVLILGGGSNVLFTKDFDGLIIHNAIPGLRIAPYDADHSLLYAGAGENWHNLVLFSLHNQLYGAENLSLIPGSAGAAPIQNIGAYGVELKDLFHSLKCIHLDTLDEMHFSAADCRFGYRDSIFKRELKNKCIITEVCLRLNHVDKPRTQYGDIQRILDENGLPVNAHHVSQAVIKIRRSKLPDPQVLGNAGSFFKNPVITHEHYRTLKENFPEMPGYADPSGTKIPAGWLIERSGLKGFRDGPCGIHVNQALVIVNYGNATGKEVFELSDKVIETIKQTFGIILEREVNVI